MLKGRIFDVQRFSVHDGPGIRTTVFMKGCTLSCAWCHNPEGISFAPSVRFSAENCIACGRCGGKRIAENAPLCLTEGLTAVGKDVTVEELLLEVLRDRDFFREEGGVTFSGGEALCQADFVAEVLRRLKQEGVNTAIDTAGFVPFENIEKTLPYCDLYLYDVKCIDVQKHKRFTGQENGLILSNLRRLGEIGVPLWIRVPVIPSFNDTLLEMTAIAKEIQGIKSVREVTLIPYHTLGKSKYEELGLTPRYHTETKITQSKILEFSLPFIQRGIPVK